VAPAYHFPQKGIGRLRRSIARAAEYGSPYKGWLSYSVSKPRSSRFEHNPNLYFHIDPSDEDGDQVLVAGGLYMPSSKQLRMIREAIARDASAYDRLFANPSFKKRFPGGFSSDRISTRAPRGFDPAHPRGPWLKLQAFFVWRSYTSKEYSAAGFAKLVANDWAQIVKLNDLLEAAIRGVPVRDEPHPEASTRHRISQFEGPRHPMDF
ncbi:MAG: DUF2461 family protein, partial [Bdellovibrionota bacterium]